MGTRVLEQRFCDAPACGSEDDVETVEIRLNRRTYRLDLCGKHRDVIVDLVSNVKAERRSARPLDPSEIPKPHT
jgi:hypothetical protein